MTFLQEYATYREIKSQTEAWAQALDVVNASSLPQAGDYDQVIFYWLWLHLLPLACSGGFVSRVDWSRGAGSAGRRVAAEFTGKRGADW